MGVILTIIAAMLLGATVYHRSGIIEWLSIRLSQLFQFVGLQGQQFNVVQRRAGAYIKRWVGQKRANQQYDATQSQSPIEHHGIFANDAIYENQFNHTSCEVAELFKNNLLDRLVPRQHPFAINANKMMDLLEVGVTLRNSSKPWDDAKRGIYAIPLFTLTSDGQLVKEEQAKSQKRFGPSFKSVIQDRVEANPQQAKEAFKQLQNDIRRRHINPFVLEENYDVLLLTSTSQSNQIGGKLTWIDDFGRYAGGGRCCAWVNDEKLLYRATLSETDYMALDAQVDTLYQSLQRSFSEDQDAQHFLLQHEVVWKSRMYVDMATEVIWAKLSKFINQAERVTHSVTQAQVLALPKHACVKLNRRDYEKITTYMRHSVYFLDYQEATRLRCAPSPNLKLKKKAPRVAENYTSLPTNNR